MLDAAAACCGGDDEVDAEGGEVGGGVVGDEVAVSAHGGFGAVEDGALGGVLPAEGPVPVGLGAFVPALVTKGLFVEVDVVAVEGIEEALVIVSLTF